MDLLIRPSNAASSEQLPFTLTEGSARRASVEPGLGIRGERRLSALVCRSVEHPQTVDARVTARAAAPA